MDIHEYQAKELLAKYGVPVPAGYPAMSVDEAVDAAKKLPGPLWVVKAQIHAGGRGKGKFKELPESAKGGVRLAHSIDEVRENAAEMLGKTLVTIQTGPHGKQVQRLYITDGVDIAKEFYLALLVDRESSRIAIVASTEGGMDIEAVAHDTPEKIETLTIDPATGLMPHHGRAVAAALGLTGDLAKLGQVAGEAEGRGDGSPVVRHQAGCRVDRQGLDLLGRVVGDRLDVHAALGRGDDGDPAAFAVDEQRKVEFLGDVDAVGDVEPLDLLAVRACLDRDQRLAEHLCRVFADLVDRM